jgi:D-psicose/D-tagatose/L-ribulose 3-epimerase
MRFGCCVEPALIEAAADAGYDFVELPADTICPERPEAEFHRVQEELSGASIGLDAWDRFPSPEVRICGPSVDWPRLARYVNTALRRIAALGGSVIALKSRECRAIPQGFDLGEARAQVLDFLRMCCAAARAHGMILGIEPGAGEQPDVAASLAEAVELARLVGAPEVGVLPNWSDLRSGDQSAFDVTDAGLWLAHVHIAAADLKPERPGSDSARDLAEALRLADYDGRVAIQGDWSEPDRQLRESLELARHLWADP